MKRYLKMDLIYLAGLVGTLVVATSPFWLLSNAEKDKNLASWLQASVGGAGMLLVALTLELQRHQIRENTESTLESSALAKKQIELMHKTLRSQIQPIVTLHLGRGIAADYFGTVVNIGKDLAILRSIHFHNATLNVSATGFHRFVTGVVERLRLQHLPVLAETMNENFVLQRQENTRGFLLRVSNRTNPDEAMFEEDQRDTERLLRALDGTTVKIEYDNVLLEREAAAEGTLRYVPYEPNA